MSASKRCCHLIPYIDVYIGLGKASELDMPNLAPQSIQFGDYSSNEGLLMKHSKGASLHQTASIAMVNNAWMLAALCGPCAPCMGHVRSEKPTNIEATPRAIIGLNLANHMHYLDDAIINAKF
jgi:hypothetical protein